MIVMTLAEHGFEGMCRGWRVHVVVPLAGKSRMKSRNAWDLTQTLAMLAIIAQTTDDNSKSFGIMLNEFRPVLYKVMTDRCFGYLVGGNARPLNAIYQAHQLEEEAVLGKAVKDTGKSRSMRQQAATVIQELHMIACDDDINAYLTGKQMRRY